MKGLMAGPEAKEETMKIIINHELAGRNESELSVLFHIVSRHLALTMPCSPERRNVLASLENISRARLAAMMAPA
jgi:hypothetical protein